jgi:hypothetical protein
MLVVALAAIVPLLIGFIYYNPKVLGTAWMNASGLTEEKLKEANMGKIFGFTYLFAFMYAFVLFMFVVHQTDIYSLYAGDPNIRVEGSAVSNRVASLMLELGDNFRTFKHGAFHGVVIGLFTVLPVLGINSLFERKSFKYIFIHTGYWVITTALMGGILCQWG